MVDPGEQCDDGKNGKQDDTCTDACKVPACGDGYLQLNLGETCDSGNNNSDNGGCTLSCKAGKCGDGLLWVGKGSATTGSTTAT
ncbi:hypothetical protein [Nannocystis sp.]|uniref:hypothetical protein n=1 Tax=Nannocystis sp. TaxID=1962667 RepID=UPI00344B6E88